MTDVIKNMAHSVRTRLQNQARETERPFSEILQYYGIERFLYRLSCSKYKEKFILKGALMFTVWNVPKRRTTLDIDFMARYDNQIKSIETVMKDVCSTETAPDGLVYDPETVKGQKIKENADYEGVRIKLLGFLDRSRISMQIDVGFGDVIYPKPEIIDFPVILNMPQPHLKGYPVESVVSEKLEAIIKLGPLNSRMKDFYDLWLIIHRFKFNRYELAAALEKTFEHRKTVIPQGKPLFAEEIYNSKSDRQILWKAFLEKEEIRHAPDKLADVAKEIEDFFINTINTINKK